MDVMACICLHRSCMQVCIERWLQQGNRTCPVTGMRLRHLELTPNFALRVAVQVPLHHALPLSVSFP